MNGLGSQSIARVIYQSLVPSTSGTYTGRITLRTKFSENLPLA
eukprot:SAG22_NODE_5441_length_1013_cov_1.566740_1_plen_42_part_10